jgi:hypothetical protein
VPVLNANSLLVVVVQARFAPFQRHGQWRWVTKLLESVALRRLLEFTMPDTTPNLHTVPMIFAAVAKIRLLDLKGDCLRLSAEAPNVSLCCLFEFFDCFAQLFNETQHFFFR